MKDKFQSFYKKHLDQYGATAQGVGWKNPEAQWIRFKQLSKLMDQESTFTINDLGCGTGNFSTFLFECVDSFEYRGYDVMQEMIDQAKQKLGNRNNLHFSKIDSGWEMEVADYTVASGIFNIRFETTDDEWLTYILSTLSAMNAKSTKGFAFNVLTSYSDKEFMKPELYYADPCFLFDHCKRSFSRNVALLHDYNQYDFTILVRK
jgi:SAM-dependent methyltransferase